MQHPSNRGFAHQRLDAYHIALELARRVVTFTRSMAPGNSELKDQLVRRVLATLRHIAEGASRIGAADRRQRFIVARGECAECDASLQTVEILRIAPAREVAELRELPDRVGAMLTGLVRSESRRLDPGPPS